MNNRNQESSELFSLMNQVSILINKDKNLDGEKEDKYQCKEYRLKFLIHHSVLLQIKMELWPTNYLTNH